jgi:Natural resistance-associated macrophage protein
MKSTKTFAPKGLEPISDVESLRLPDQPRIIRPGLRLNIRGRSVRLRGLRRPPTVLLRLLAILGPGLIASSAGNDAGGIATYSSAGAKYGYDLIWVMLVMTVSLAVVQRCARGWGRQRAADCSILSANCNSGFISALLAALRRTNSSPHAPTLMSKNKFHHRP